MEILVKSCLNHAIVFRDDYIFQVFFELVTIFQLLLFSFCQGHQRFTEEIFKMISWGVIESINMSD